MRTFILTVISSIEVDEAVKESETQERHRDGTGGRGLNGHISNALVKEDKKQQVLKSAV